MLPIVDALKVANLGGLRLAIRNRDLARTFWSEGIRRYKEMMRIGLRAGDPVAFVYRQGWAAPSTEDRVVMAVTTGTAGGTRLDELLVLATVTAVLRPRKVFEIGTFDGRTTSVFILNAPPGAQIVTVDLPPDGQAEVGGTGYLDTDIALIKARKVGAVLHDLALDGRYEQVFCDSRALDVTPHAGSVELGFIDGAHTREFVENDTRKMAAMMGGRGIVFWHDYGGTGRFRGLTAYLDELSARIPVYRVAGTSLAWGPASAVRELA